jgi:type II secretory pathway pseudopilin PulG
MEVVVALAILAIVGGGLFGVAAESMSRVENAGRRERDLLAANNLMSAVALWSREDLDRRLGERRQGPWILEIERVSARVYAARIRDTMTHELMLATALYRTP